VEGDGGRGSEEQFRATKSLIFLMGVVFGERLQLYTKLRRGGKYGAL
jgi:hypothetical protein